MHVKTRHVSNRRDLDVITTSVILHSRQVLFYISEYIIPFIPPRLCSSECTDPCEMFSRSGNVMMSCCHQSIDYVVKGIRISKAVVGIHILWGWYGLGEMIKGSLSSDQCKLQ